MRINAHAGHTSQNGASPGAGSRKTGIWESIEDRKVKDALIAALRARGCTVYDCTSEGSSERDNLVRIVSKCNAHSVDLDVSIHMNSYNGNAHGVEVEVYSENSKAYPYAKRACANIAALGFTNRGVKVMPYLYVLRHTNAPAMLVECFFCDNEADCKQYRKVGAKAIGEAIANAIIAGAKPTPQPVPVTPSKPVSKPAKSGLAVDGSWGPATTKAVQKWLGTTIDGVVSNQPTANKRYLCNCSTASWQFKSSGYGAGSQMARALQKKIGADVDGWFGKQSVMCLQKWLGVSVDGSCGPATVKALQKYLNSRG